MPTANRVASQTSRKQADRSENNSFFSLERFYIREGAKLKVLGELVVQKSAVHYQAL